MQLIITKILPVFLLITLGYFLRISKFIDDNGIQSIKKLIIKVALPILLFKIFFNMVLKNEYIIIVCVSIIFYILVYLVGKLLTKIKYFNFTLFPYLTTGCAFGLLGVPLFQIVFGVEKLNYLSILGIGNELFVWFILITLLKFEFNNERLSLQTVKNFIKSPMIVGVLSGLLINILNFNTFILNNFLLKGVYDTIESLSRIASPLILIVTGYGIVINKYYIKESIKYVLLRLVVLFVIGYTIKYFILDHLIQNQYFNFAFFTFIIISPPITMPILASKYCDKEKIELANNIVIVSICVCLILFLAYVLIISSKGLI